MTSRSGDDAVRIGRFEVPLGDACSWVHRYSDAKANQVWSKPYAYPAYDFYQANLNQPDVLNDGDLLAPMLLNVNIKIRSFYGLQLVRDRLQDALRQPALAAPLAALSDAELQSLIGPLYSVLDCSDAPWGIKATALSKILHRKCPESVVLHDKWVRACYIETKHVPVARDRSWADYMTAISRAIRDDIIEQPNALAAVRDAAQGTGLSDIRLVDILAWNVGSARANSR